MYLVHSYSMHIGISVAAELSNSQDLIDMRSGNWFVLGPLRRRSRRLRCRS